MEDLASRGSRWEPDALPTQISVYNLTLQLIETPGIVTHFK